MSSTARLLADDYSSTGQREWRLGIRGATAKFWRENLLGQLRFDTLVSETLVVPDTHLFDGTFFLETPPEELIKKLGRGDPEADGEGRLPIEFRARRDTLEHSLADLLRHKHDRLNHFPFKSIVDDAVRLALAEQLGLTPQSVLDDALRSADDVVTAVGSVLRDCLDVRGLRDLADEAIGPLEESWRRWLAVEERLTIHVWDRAYKLRRALDYDPLPRGVPATDAGRRAHAIVMDRVREGELYRGDVTRELDGMRVGLSKDESGDVDIVEKWYSRGRYRALAWQHVAVPAQLDRPWLRPATILQAQYRQALEEHGQHIQLPPGVIARLGRMETPKFRRMVYENEPELDAWWHRGDEDGLRRVAEKLADLDEAPAEDKNPLGVSEWVGAAGPAGGTATGAALGGPGGAAAGAVVGFVGRILSSRRRTATPADRTRDRILEAWTERATD